MERNNGINVLYVTLGRNNNKRDMQSVSSASSMFRKFIVAIGMALAVAKKDNLINLLSSSLEAEAKVTFKKVT